MSNNQPVEKQLTRPDGPYARRALIIGGGIPAQVASQALTDIGVEVTFARLLNTPSHVYFTPPIPDIDDELNRFLSGESAVKVIDLEDQAPVVSRNHDRFKALFSDGKESLYDCIFLAPGISLLPKPAILPEGTELFTFEIVLDPRERVVFLLDYEHSSDPALGTSAIRAAAHHVLNGGESVVCFRNAPVPHLFGESLYDSARNVGVQFVRFGEDLPVISSLDNGEGQLRFRLSTPDIIDDGKELMFDCTRVLSVTGPDASSIPRWAVKLANGDLDEQGFILSDSVHCNSGCSVASGIFLVGETTGNPDLVDGVAQAKAAAAKAVAWIETSRSKIVNPPTSVSNACVGCLTCHRVCPHGAISVNPRVSRLPVQHWPSLCRGCGICISVCPTVAIDLMVCTEDSLLAAAREFPPQDSNQTVLVFGCERSAGILAQTIEMPEHVRFQAVPCAGRVSEYAIWSALAAGFRGVFVVACHHGNCASRTGADWAASRIRRGLGTGLFQQGSPRLGYVTVASNEPARFQRLLRQFTADNEPGTGTATNF